MGKDTVILERRFVPAGKRILKEGEEGFCAYLIQSGKVQVYTEHNGKRVKLAELGTGQIFGELALIFDEPRSATVEAIEDCNFIIITRSNLKHKMERSDATIRAIMEMLTRRIVSTNNSLFCQNESIEDLMSASSIIYENVLKTLPRAQQNAFQDAVLPKLDACLEAMRDFKKSMDENQ